MAVTTDKNQDVFYKSKKDSWVGFTRLVTWVVVFLIVILAGMAIFLT